MEGNYNLTFANKIMKGLRVSQARRLFNRPLADILYFTRFMILKKLRGFYSIIFQRTENNPGMIHLPEKPIFESDDMGYLGEQIYSEGKIVIFDSEVEIGWPPNWDYVNGDDWPKEKSSWNMKYYGDGIKSDIKDTWEIHRMQWLPSVAYKARQEMDEDLANEVLDVIISYFEMHRIGKSVAWMEGIEVSLRSISIIEALTHVKDTVSDYSKITEICSWLSRSAYWIEANLSTKWRVNNNHLLLELVGLGVISRVIPEHPRSQKWREKSERMLSREIVGQTISGRNWEPTTAYHRFVTEAMLVLHHYRFGEKNTDKNDIIFSTTNELFVTLNELSDKENKMSLIGDDDAGMVIPMSSIRLDVEDNSRVLSLGKKLGFEVRNIARGEKIWKKHGTGIIRNDNSICYLSSGAPQGKMRQASHRHLDMLSIAMRYKGESLILDGGTGRYFGDDELRNRFRSETSHSGIYSASNQWAKIADLFEITKPPFGRIEVLSNNSIRMRVQDRKLGYASRTVNYENDQYVVSDQLSIEDPRVRFLLKKLGQCEEDSGTWRMVFDDWEIQHRPLPRVIEIEEHDGEEVPIYSPGYGRFEKCYSIDFEHEKGSRVETVFIFNEP
mgnify:CR=1 FL=1